MRPIVSGLVIDRSQLTTHDLELACRKHSSPIGQVDMSLLRVQFAHNKCPVLADHVSIFPGHLPPLKHGGVRSCEASWGISRNAITKGAAVVHKHRGVAGKHIVRVDVGNGQVVHLFVAVVVTDGFDRGFGPVVGRKLLAGSKVPGVDPFCSGLAPEGVVLGGFESGGGVVG